MFGNAFGWPHLLLILAVVLLLFGAAKLPALAKHDYRPGFFVELARKDLGLAIALAEGAGAESSVARAAFALYDAATAAGHGRLDSSGLLVYLESFPRSGA